MNLKVLVGAGGLVAGIVLLAVGVPAWIASAVQILVNVPRGKLITTGPTRVLLPWL